MKRKELEELLNDIKYSNILVSITRSFRDTMILILIIGIMVYACS